MALLDAVQQLQVGLDYHLARHNILASNLAHLDTPGYKPLDLQRTSAAAPFHEALQVALEQTEPGHLSGSVAAPRGASDETWKTVADPTVGAGADGNAVSVDREAAKIAANQVRYEALASLTSGELSGLLWAANDGRG
jgi:flagellar basal-body rod protein FlgB